MNTKILVLVSGGLDSVTALYEARSKYEVVAGLGFSYGSKHNHRELPCAKQHCTKLGIRHQVIQLDFINELFESHLLQTGGGIPDGHYEDESMRQTVVPFRNGIMLAIAAGLAESLGVDALMIAAHSGDHAIYPDCRENFMSAMAQTIQFGTYGEIKVLRPFISMNKAEIVMRGIELGVDYSQTWSCYKGGEIHCGVCGTCVERREAFSIANIADPTVYEVADDKNQ